MKSNVVRKLARKAGQDAGDLTRAGKRALVRKARRRGKLG